MSAIEMMDVKMDAGMMCNQIKREVRTLEQSAEVVFSYISENLHFLLFMYNVFVYL